jgi:hypothetical protein
VIFLDKLNALNYNKLQLLMFAAPVSRNNVKVFISGGIIKTGEGLTNRDSKAARRA